MLEPDEPPAFEIVRPTGASRAFLLCDHASRRLPRALGDLGLDAAELGAHIAWDIGAADVARIVSEALDAPLVLSGYSRLAIDCNRPPGTPASVPQVTCEIPVPGNADLDRAARTEREDACFWPYHRAVARLLDERDQRGKASAIVSVHSFTPSLYGRDRPWHVGVMYGRDRALAGRLLAALASEAALVLGDNEPYRVTDDTDYGVPTYAERAGREGVLVELRQDLIANAEGAARLGRRLSSAIAVALNEPCAIAGP